MSLIIGVINAKGGVGKTVTSIYLACALSASGHDVELWDADLRDQQPTGPSPPQKTIRSFPSLCPRSTLRS